MLTFVRSYTKVKTFIFETEGGCSVTRFITLRRDHPVNLVVVETVGHFTKIIGPTFTF